MKILSIRAAWAWAIIYAGKDVENRTWETPYRGRFLVHASATKDSQAWGEMVGMAMRQHGPLFDIPDLKDMPHGGIIGSVELTDCGRFLSSPWWIGPHGFKLSAARPLTFIPLKARLGLYQAPDKVLAEVARQEAA